MHAEKVKYYDPHQQRTHSINNIRFSRYLYWAILLWNHYVLRRRIIKIEPWISINWGRVEHNNWGDDIIMFFLREISSDCLLPGKAYAYPYQIDFKCLPGSMSVYSIGSVLHLITRPNSIVWGSGLINESLLPKTQQLNILAVRGPQTRKVLLANGIECPEVYGDPALLLPYYYSPQHIKKKYKVGIIPHYVDADKEELSHLAGAESAHVIHMSGYRSWRSVIDQILSCEFIVSSSLHGLIIAEAYHIPNLWVEIKEPIVGDISRRFKYHDFFQSIGLDRERPYCITKDTTLSALYEQKRNYQAASGLDLRPLVRACPFQIKDDIISRLG